MDRPCWSTAIGVWHRRWIAMEIGYTNERIVLSAHADDCGVLVMWCVPAACVIVHAVFVNSLYGWHKHWPPSLETLGRPRGAAKTKHPTSKRHTLHKASTPTVHSEPVTGRMPFPPSEDKVGPISLGTLLYAAAKVRLDLLQHERNRSLALTMVAGLAGAAVETPLQPANQLRTDVVAH